MSLNDDILKVAREAIAKKKEADDAHHSAAQVRAGDMDNHEVKDAVCGIKEWIATGWKGNEF